MTNQPQKGHLLVAEPSILGDVSFTRSVILLAECSQAGAVGFIMNKPLEFTLQDLIPEMESSITIYNGGPVEQDNLYFIHTVPELISNSMEISNGIYWGGDFETTRQLVQTGIISDTQIRFFLGYSGWETNQLKSELDSGSWFLTENQLKQNLIRFDLSNYWKQKMTELGGDYLIWSNAPENPLLN
ncbi:MAG: transcriptional regulator [Flavobacterium sp. BFFFF2]|nr:MAG: transcriptional regulator [Flavobacterium sp. BFFFF2]